MSLLEEAWSQRERRIYPALFGSAVEQIYVLSAELFELQFGCESVDPQWLLHGVFRYPPTADRASWLYVTSGLSNPWGTEAPAAYSGLGLELVLELPQDEDWAILLLQSLLAFNVLLASGRYGDRPVMGHGDRIPQTIEPNIGGLILWEPQHFPAEFELVSGKVELIQVTGVTAAELEYAQVHGSAALCEKLQAQQIFPVTDARRESIALA